MRHILRSQSGQTIVEYVIMITAAISLVAVIGYGFRNITLVLWQKMACEVAAPCPDCEPPSNVKNKLLTVCD